jgi:hypothetical protein
MRETIRWNLKITIYLDLKCHRGTYERFAWAQIRAIIQSYFEFAWSMHV